MGDEELRALAARAGFVTEVRGANPSPSPLALTLGLALALALTGFVTEVGR